MSLARIRMTQNDGELESDLKFYWKYYPYLGQKKALYVISMLILAFFIIYYFFCGLYFDIAGNYMIRALFGVW